MPGSRNIVICCDEGDDAIRSNLATIYSSIDRSVQLHYFQRYRPSLFLFRWFDPSPVGIHSHTVEAYAFLAKTFSPGDRVFLFGAGSGGTVVQQLGRVLTACGLAKDPDSSEIAYSMFSRGPVDAAQFRDTHSVECVPHFIGIFDAVVSPGARSLVERATDPAIAFAYHAVSLDDRWRFREPLLWEESRRPRVQKLEQVWFPGTHGDVTGVFPERGVSDCVLTWMLERAAASGLQLKPDWNLDIHPNPVDGPIHRSAHPFLLALIPPRERRPPHGALVHQSVFDRIAAGTDYKPRIPGRYVVIPWEAEKPVDQLRLESELEALREQVKTDSRNAALWQQYADMLHALNRTIEYADAIQKVSALNADDAFAANLKQEIRIAALELKELDFFGTFRWTLAPRINVLLGKNGYGKSHLLTLMVVLLQNAKDHRDRFIGDRSARAAQAEIQVTRDDSTETVRLTKVGFETNTLGKVPILAISELRFIDKSRDELKKEDLGAETDLKLHGADRFLTHLPLGPLINDSLYRLCLTYNERKTLELPVVRLYQDVVRRLTSNDFELKSIERVPNSAQYRIFVVTEGNTVPVLLQQASQGTLSVMAIVGLIFEFLVSVYPDVEEVDVSSQPAIVFIDELDAHLHPNAQRKVLGILRNNFPEVQFIVAAHSPLIVAGCKRGEVAVLRRATDRPGFGLEQPDRHFLGATTTELYNLLFEIEEKDETFLKYAAMFPFRAQIQADVKALEQRKSLSDAEAQEYGELLAIQRALAIQLAIDASLRNKTKLDAEEAAMRRKILLEAGFNPDDTTVNAEERGRALSMTPEQKARLEFLNTKQRLPASDEKRLNQLYEDLYYLGEFEQVERGRTAHRREGAGAADGAPPVVQSAQGTTHNA